MQIFPERVVEILRKWAPSSYIPVPPSEVDTERTFDVQPDHTLQIRLVVTVSY